MMTNHRKDIPMTTKTSPEIVSHEEWKKLYTTDETLDFMTWWSILNLELSVRGLEHYRFGEARELFRDLSTVTTAAGASDAADRIAAEWTSDEIEARNSHHRL
jgi:hypothetical protein